MRRWLKASLAASGILLAAGIAFLAWRDAPQQFAARVTGLELPPMTLVYREEWVVPPFSRKWFRTWIFKLDDEAAARFVACPFPGYKKNKRFATVVLDFLGVAVEIPGENCYRHEDYEQYKDGSYSTMVFARNLLFVKLRR